MFGSRKSAKTAYWIRQTHLFRRDEYLCSACRSAVYRPAAVCPGCGARMTRSKYDPTWVDEMEGMNAIFDDH